MQLRSYQRRALDAIYRYFERHDGNPLVISPTGSGKSVMIGGFCKEVLESWPHQRIMILSHVKELLEQNYGKIKGFWPQAPAGLYCAGLGQKRSRDSITVASIQSVHKKAHIFGWRDLVLIDECHLLAPESDSMYRRFIADLKRTNPHLKVIGFTATAYRTRTGSLHRGEGRLFTDVACEISLQELLAEGHVSPLVSKSGEAQADMQNVRITAGEFNARDMEAEIDREALTRAALDEVFRLAGGRKSWLFFCSGVDHAAHVRDALRGRGVAAEAVTGETPPAERDRILREFKAGRIRAVCNMAVLTTGFDAPNIDLIVMLRATTSPGLYIQILGRGMRLAPGKEDCLVLDFAGNLERHGPITHVKPPGAASKRGKKAERHVAACLICPECRMASPLGSSECGDCGRAFARPESARHGATASTAEVMTLDGRKIDLGEWVAVDAVRYHRHEKPGKIPTMRVEYQAGMADRYSEWICVAHPPGYARAKAIEWWKRRGGGEMPDNLGTAVMTAQGLATPARIRVRKKDNGYWEVLDHEFEDRPHIEAEPAGQPGRAGEMAGAA